MSSPAMCPLCRVANSDEHAASGWHQFNQRLFADGKMPVSEPAYLRYEKPKEDAAASGLPSPAVDASVGAHLELNKHNVGKWHWEESDLSAWAKDRVEELAKAISIPVPAVTAEDGTVCSLAGAEIKDAELVAVTRMRKGKYYAVMDCKFTLEWSAQCADKYKQKGSCDVEMTGDDDEAEVTQFKLEGPEGAEKTAVMAVLKKEGKKAVQSLMLVLSKELKDKAQPVKLE